MNIKKDMFKIVGIMILTLSITSGDEIELSELNDYNLDSKMKQGETKQSIHLGFANTTGNTETLNLNAEYKLTAKRAGIKDKDLNIYFKSKVFISENNDIRDNEEYNVNLDLEQLFSEKYFSYLSMEWLKNPFLNFENKYIAGLGIGKEIIISEKQTLKVKLGVAYNNEEYSDLTKDETFASLTQYIEYNYKFNKISDLNIKAGISENIEDISEDYELLILAEFKFIIGEHMNIIIQEEVRYDNISTIDRKTDTKSIVKIGYSF